MSGWDQWGDLDQWGQEPQHEPTRMSLRMKVTLVIVLALFITMAAAAW